MPLPIKCESSRVERTAAARYQLSIHNNKVSLIKIAANKNRNPQKKQPRSKRMEEGARTSRRSPGWQMNQQNRASGDDLRSKPVSGHYMFH